MNEPTMDDRIEDLRNAHSKYGIYMECDCNEGDHEDGKAVVYIEDVGDTCADPHQFVCRQCHTDDGECHENSEYGEWPCDTTKALAIIDELKAENARLKALNGNLDKFAALMWEEHSCADGKCETCEMYTEVTSDDY